MRRKEQYCEHSVRAWLLMLKTVEIVKDELRRINSLGKYGVSFGQFGVLATLRLAGKPISQVELSKLMLVTKGNITAVIGTLEKNGMVRRRSDVRDGRLKLLNLTAKGRRVIEKVILEMNREISALFEKCEKKKIKYLSEDLAALLECFSESGEVVKDIEKRISAIKRLERNP